MVKASALAQPCGRLHTVALIGMDGSGKSTQAEILCQELAGRNQRVLLVHPFGRKLFAFLPEHAGGHQAGRGIWRLKAMRQLTAAVEMFDIAVYAWAVYARGLLQSLASHADVWLVSDRAFDDVLMKHRRLGTFSPRILAGIRRLAPGAGQTIWLHTEPEVAMRRDGDFDASYYRELHASYTSAARQHRWQIVPTSNRTCETVAADIAALLGLDDGNATAGKPDKGWVR